MIRADKRRYHFIYKTTCLFTNRYYIGMHSTENLKDGYIGSGKRLWRSIRKHGKENHICEIIEFLDSRKELSIREAQIINEELIGDDLCMNLNLGGNGSWCACNTTKTPEQRRELSKAGNAALKQKLETDEEFKRKLSEKHSRITTRSHQLGLSHNINKSPKAFNKENKHTEISKKKMSDTHKRNGNQVKERNSQWGIARKAVNKDGITKKILLEELEVYLASGWVLGFSEVFKKTMSDTRKRMNTMKGL